MKRVEFIITGIDPAEEGYPTVARLKEVFEEAANLSYEKSKGYGNAWRRQGWMGNLARIMSKVSRLRNMLWRDMHLESTEETTEDTMLDLINLTAFALLNKRDGNRWGNDA